MLAFYLENLIEATACAELTLKLSSCGMMLLAKNEKSNLNSTSVCAKNWSVHAPRLVALIPNYRITKIVNIFEGPHEFTNHFE